MLVNVVAYRPDQSLATLAQTALREQRESTMLGGMMRASKLVLDACELYGVRPHLRVIPTYHEIATDRRYSVPRDGTIPYLRFVLSCEGSRDMVEGALQEVGSRLSWWNDNFSRPVSSTYLYSHEDDGTDECKIAIDADILFAIADVDALTREPL